MALKHLVDINLDGNEIQNVVLQNLATAPSGVEGQIYYDTATNSVKVHTGTAFVRIGAIADGTTITDTAGTFAVGAIPISSVTGLATDLATRLTSSDISDFATVDYVDGEIIPPALISDGSEVTLASGITGPEVRTLIGAGTSSLAIGTSASTALAGNTTTITSTQAGHISTNNGKVSDTGTPALLSDGSVPTLNTGMTAAGVRGAIGAGTSSLAIGTTASTAKAGNITTITTAQALAITANTAKVTDTGTPAILSDGSSATLSSGISAAEIRTLISAASASDISGFASTQYVDDEIAAVIAVAPAALDTLNELAAAIGDDADYAGTVTTLLSNKLNSSVYTAADVLAKLLTVDGAGSGIDADKLDGQSSAYYSSYNNLTNKPDIPTFVSKTVTGAASGATDLTLGFSGYANIQIYEDGVLIMTDITQDGAGASTAQLTASTDFTIVAVGD